MTKISGCKLPQVVRHPSNDRRNSSDYLNGAKGIGRFAVRYLGDHLTLESTAFDKGRDTLTTLTATFNWPDLDKTADLSHTRIPYRLTAASQLTPPRAPSSLLVSSEAMRRSRPPEIFAPTFSELCRRCMASTLESFTVQQSKVSRTPDSTLLFRETKLLAMQTLPTWY